MSEKHEKGFEFEKKVAEFFRKKGFNKVLLRERVKGKSGIKHEVDVLVFDNLDQNKMVWACQCKYWNAKIGKKEIGEWIQTCKDINVDPAFVALKFSSEAKKYAEAYHIYWITDKQLGIEPTQVIGKDFKSWKEKLDSIDNEIDKFLFCLKSIYQTEILQNAKRAKDEFDEELRFFEGEQGQLFKLFRDPNNQRLTKFLNYINRIEEDYGYAYAFGELRSNIFLAHKPYNLMGAYQIPSAVGKVNRMILSTLEKMDVKDLEPHRINWGDKCRIFLEAWISIAKSTLNIEKEMEIWRKDKNREGVVFYAKRTYYTSEHEPNMNYDQEKGIIIGKPEKIKNVFENGKDFWKYYLSNKEYLSIKRLSLLFKTDLTCVNEDSKWPIIDGKEDSCEIFRRSLIVKKAYENNKMKVEKIISDLKTEQ